MNTHFSDFLIFRALFLFCHFSQYEVFAEPVTEEAAPQYFEFVKTPMDLGTMRAKAEAEEYASVDAFLADAQLVRDNCQKYNGGWNEPWVELANELLRTIQNRVKKVLSSSPHGVKPCGYGLLRNRGKKYFLQRGVEREMQCVVGCVHGGVCEPER